MALADTAALVASLELQDKFSANAKKYENTIGRMERQTSSLGRIGGQVSSGIGTAVGNLSKLAVVGVGVIAANVAAGIQSLVRLEEVTAATNAVIASTGGAAGITAQEVRDLAEEYENLNATMDDKVIQSAENVLLTFTAIGEKAFPLALEAALNMNQALGGGEEGLQSTIIQVGKALQDPIKGITALRKVGVNFSAAQTEIIRKLVEENKLFEAQQLILNELAVEFGGQFAAAGDTAAGKFAKLKDTIEDTQVALATAFLPVLEKVADKLTLFLADPEVQQAIADFGEEAAAAFEDLIAVAEKLPWDSIGAAFKLMGTGAKAVLDAFVSMPPWVQTAILTAWGTNKLTGGMLGNIVTTLGTSLIKHVLGINAGVVNINAATVNGGVGGGTVAGGGARAAGANVIRIVGGATIFTGIAAALGELIAQNVTRPLDPEKFDFNAVAGASGLFNRPEEANNFIRQLSDELGITQLEVKAAIVDAVNNNGLTFTEAVRQLQGKLVNVGQDTNARLREAETEDHRQTQTLTNNLAAVRDAKAAASAASATALQQLSAQNVKLQQIAAKNFSPTVQVAVTSHVSISEIQRRITSQQIAIGRGFQEFE